jgi:hypothetical protein
MKIDDTKAATAGTAIGWLLLALGIVVWLAAIPITGAALFFARKITIEAEFATIGAVIYGVAGGLGLSAIAASEHRSARIALWVYLGLLAVAAVVAVLLNVLA